MSNLTNCHAIVILDKIKVQQTNWSNKMKNPAKKLTLSITAGLLLSSLLLPSAFAASLPAGAVVSNGLTWTRNNSTFASPGRTVWLAANNTCNALIAGGHNDWRLPVSSEFSALDKGALKSAGWTLDFTWSSTASDDVGYHYLVDLSNGNVLSSSGSLSSYVSCVR